MSKKINYTDEPLGELRVVPDFIPHPDALEFREEIAKILARGDEDIAAGIGIDMETVMAEADALLAKKPWVKIKLPGCLVGRGCRICWSL